MVPAAVKLELLYSKIDSFRKILKSSLLLFIE
jgi:hypothetical protein